MKQTVVRCLLLITLALSARGAAAQDVQAFDRIYLGSTQCAVRTGSGSPNSAVIGSVCDYYIDTATSNLYRKQSGTATNTGWEVVPMTSLTNTWSAIQLFGAQIKSSNWVTHSTGWTADFGGNAEFNGSLFSPAISGGTLALTTPLPCTSGGTGAASWTVGGVVFASGSCGLTALTPVAVGQALISNGAGSGPVWSGSPTLASVTSTAWVSHSAGWIVDAGGNADLQDLWTRELHALSFTAENENVFDGSALVLPSQAVLEESFTVPALATSSGNLRVEYKQGTSGSTSGVFSYGDTVTLRTFARSGGALVVSDAIGTVAGPSISLSSLTSSSTTATWTSSSPHLQTTGNTVVVTGATQPNYNGTFTITVTDSTHFTYTMPGTATSPATGSPAAVSKQPDTSNAAYQQWTFTRGGTSATGGTMATSAVVPTKTVVLDYGVSGNGFVRINAVAQTQVLTALTSSSTTATATTASAHGYLTGDIVVISGASQPAYNGAWSITKTGATTFTYTMNSTTSTPATCSSPCMAAGAYDLNGPTIDVSTWATAPTYANTTLRARVGNCRDWSGTLEYGLCVGDFANKHYVRFTDQNAEIAGIPLRLYDGSTETVRLDASVPSIALGSTLPSAYGTGVGIWMGKDSGVYKFRVGDPSGDELTWDGSHLGVKSSTTTIDSTGMHLAPYTSSATYDGSHAFDFTVATGLLGVGGFDPGTTRGLIINSTWTGAGTLASTSIKLNTDNNGSGTATLTLQSATALGHSRILLQANEINLSCQATCAGITLGGDVTFSGNATQSNGGGTLVNTYQPGFLGTSTGDIQILAGNSTKIKCFSGGGCTMGTPTGGDKGAGNLNVAGDLWKNGTAYNNPRWTLQYYFTGSADHSGPYEVPDWYRGLRPLDEHRAFVAQHYDLPLMLEEQGAGVFRRGDLLLASVEEAYLYIYQLNDRITALEREVRQLQRK